MRMELFKESCDGCFHDKQPQSKAVASKKAISQYLCQSICSLESKTNFYIYPYTSYPIFILVGVVEQKKNILFHDTGWHKGLPTYYGHYLNIYIYIYHYIYISIY